MSKTQVLNLPNLSLDKQRPPERYTKKSRKHPAKMYVPLARWAIERYTKEGDWVLDPMMGIGTVPVEALWLNRNAVGMEYEYEWYHEAGANLRKAWAEEASVGVSYEGDARFLSTVVKEGPFELILFSPPYGPILSSKRQDEGVHAAQIMQRLKQETGMWPVPPDVFKEYTSKWRKSKPEGLYSTDEENVGNMSMTDYKDAMVEIYDECLQVVEDNGVMALVTRNPCKNWEQFRLDMLTIDLAQCAGWIFKERWYSPIFRYSFWIRKYKERCEEKGLYDVVPTHEDLLVFERP
jgi:tRNA G10  N-methylase Trm11